jgi:uncharacterized protein (DUF2062 family)
MRALIRRWLPSPEVMRRSRALRWLGPLLDRPWLWAANRRGVAVGLAIGLLFAFLLPLGQALAAGVVAIWARANLPVAVAATLLSNPFTTPAILAGAYYLGARVLGMEPNLPSEPGLTMVERASSLGIPLLAGLGMLGAAASLTGFLLVQVSWGICPVLRLMRRRLGQRRPSRR